MNSVQSKATRKHLSIGPQVSAPEALQCEPLYRFQAVGSPEKRIGFAAVRSPLRTYRMRCDFPTGTSIAQMLAAAGIAPEQPARIFVGDRLIGDHERGLLPRAGDIVTVRAIPAGHGKNSLEIVLEVVLAAATWNNGATTDGEPRAGYREASIPSIVACDAGTGYASCTHFRHSGRCSVPGFSHVVGSWGIP